MSTFTTGEDDAGESQSESRLSPSEEGVLSYGSEGCTMCSLPGVECYLSSKTAHSDSVWFSGP